MKFENNFNKWKHKFEQQHIFYQYICSEIKKGVCLNEFDGEYEHNITKISQFDDEDQVASHPILLYKLVKQMHWFYNEVYLLKLQSVASNTGNSLIVLISFILI